MSEEIPTDKVEEAPVKSAEADGPLAGERLAWVDVKPEPMAEYNDKVQKAIAGVTVWHVERRQVLRRREARSED